MLCKKHLLLMSFNLMTSKNKIKYRLEGKKIGEKIYKG
jgi:hypothetical protein